MRIEVREAIPDERTVFENLVQFYRYDISEVRGDAGQEVGSDGKYVLHERFVSYWSDSVYHPFLVRVDDYLAGFVIVSERSFLSGDANLHDVAEFFILRKYRRHGIGAYVAMWIFDYFPGRWEVRQHAVNTGAQAFWRRVIAAYTGGRFAETFVHDSHQHGPVHSFDNTDRTG